FRSVKWRYDYAAARHEAENSGRPLLLDIGSENCVFCVKLDNTTFRDPAIVALLNEHFVPLKVHGPDNRSLIEYLRIESYPTIVLAAPDSKILVTLGGYQDAAQLHDYLQR